MKKAPKTAVVVDEFEFEDAGRKFSCKGEISRSTQERWWWFRVSSDTRGQRYAPFRAEPTDTAEGVQARVVAFYDDLLAKRAMPPTKRHWAQRSTEPAAATAAATEADTEAPPT